MNNAWTVEFSRILAVILSTLLFGFTTGLWVVAILLPVSVYILWTLFQIRAFERWIRLGTKTNMAPDASGIWALIVQHIYRTQKKNKESKRRFKDMAGRFESVIAALPEATIVLNSHLEIEWVNHAAKVLLGIDKNKDLGQRLDNLIRIPQLSLLLKNQLQLEHFSQPLISQSIELESPVDSQKMLIISSVEFGKQQKLITARDISQTVSVQKLRKAFIANASHELRTPLTVIAGYLELMESDEQIPQILRNQLSNASQQATRMQKILDDLLVLSKLEEKGHNRESGQPLNIKNLLNDLVEDFKKTHVKENHKIEINIDVSLQIKAIEGEVYSLCQNLLSNAIKYSNKGSVIKICWQENLTGNACLSVSDNGEGIASEDLSRLTERFYRANVNRSRKIGGTGLGLSIVKHIIENHGGHLDIQSELSVGSTFTACFPKYRIID